MSVQLTSILAYREITENGLLSKRRLQVYKILAEVYPGSLTGSQVANRFHERCGHTSNSETIRNRITELKDRGVVESTGIVFDEYTKKRVMLWRLVDALPSKVEPKESTSRKIAKLEAEIHRLREELYEARKTIIGLGG